MTPERWRQICAVFDEALEQPVSSVQEFLRERCGDDEDLYSQVTQMLEEHRRSGFLDNRPLGPGLNAPHPPVFRDGQTVAERYRIVRYLSRGGMGEVYEARDLELNETVALKTLLPAIAANETMIARFKQEIALSRKIGHANVCRMFDLNRAEGEDGRPVLFLTMELLDGETLSTRLEREGPMPAAESLPLLQQMGAALDAAHAAGIIHRDFKPSNVMLVDAPEGTRAVVTDFGLARNFATNRSTTATVSNAIMGTLDYMAPELLTGSQASVASDVYALGMVAYRMVTGVLPFATDTPLAGAILRSRRPVPSPRGSVPTLEENWERAILRALDMDPAKRFGRAREFIAALRNETASLTVKLPVLTRRRTALAVLFAAAMLAAAVGWRAYLAARVRLAPEAQALYTSGVQDIAAGAYFAATKALADAVKLAPHAPQVRARLAEAWVELEVPERAGEQMLLVRREDTSSLDEAQQVQIEAIDREITREFAAAARKYEQLTRIVGKGNPDVAVDLGRAYEKADRPEDAMRSYQQAAEGPAHNPAAWLRIAVLYARRSKADKSKEAFDEAEKGYQLTSNLEGLTEVLIQEGIAETSRGNLDVGASYLQKGLETARTAGNLQQEINAGFRLSTNAYLAGDAAATEQFAHEAIDTARKNGLGVMAIRGLINLGNASRRKENNQQAEKYYNDALEQGRESRSGQLTALSLAALAGLHIATSRPGPAVQEAQGALAFYQPNGYAKESLQCLTIALRAKRDSGDYEGALSSTRTLIEMAEKTGDHGQMALAHENLASVLFVFEHYPAALEEYRKNVTLSVDPEHIGFAHLQCASSLWHLGRYTEAADEFAQGESFAAKFPGLVGDIGDSRAAMLLSQGRYAPAIDLAHSLIAGHILPARKANLEQLIGLALLRSGHRSEGSRKCQESWQAAEALPDAGDLVHAQVALLEARVEEGDRNAAEQVFHAAETRLASYPEAHWRALALLARLEPTYAGQARNSLHQVSSDWGEQAFRVYLTRPDIDKLSRGLLLPPTVSGR